MILLAKVKELKVNEKGIFEILLQAEHELLKYSYIQLTFKDKTDFQINEVVKITIERENA